MKWTFFFLILYFCSACHNELDVEADWEDIAIVWGIISRQDTTHYIRVEKAFLTGDVNTYDIAQNADSLYHQNLTVLLEKSTGENYELERVDGNSEGHLRDTGIFAARPNILYKIEAHDLPLAAGEQLQLRIIKSENAPPVTAKTTILGDMEWMVGLQDSTLNLLPHTKKRLAWRPGEGGKLFGLRMYIHIQERVGQEWVDKTLNWSIVRNLKQSSENRVTYNLQNLRFYHFLLNQLNTTKVIVRRFRSIDIVVSAGGQEILDSQNNGLSNQYVTCSETLPYYTNISEGRGLFSSRSHLWLKNISLSEESLEILKESPLTDVLNFQ